MYMYNGTDGKRGRKKLKKFSIAGRMRLSFRCYIGSVYDTPKYKCQ